MTSTDPIADMLTRVRNALAVHKNEVTLPHSTIKEAVAKIFVEYGYFADVSVEKDGFRKHLTITFAEGVTINEIKRISKPGRRVYAKVKDIPRIKKGRGIVIVSTPKGVMEGNVAREQKLGGELLCSVY